VGESKQRDFALVRAGMQISKGSRWAEATRFRAFAKFRLSKTVHILLKTPIK
jgi:hypothetical protein